MVVLESMMKVMRSDYDDSDYDDDADDCLTIHQALTSGDEGAKLTRF